MAILTVIIGAGASFDSIDNRTALVNSEWRPPLVKDLFSNLDNYGAILAKYPRAQAVAGGIRLALAEKSLEEILSERISTGAEEVRKQYREVPLYLQELIGEVSQHFVRFGTTLMNELVMTIANAIHEKRYSHVLYLTLNYDLFLDKALATLYAHPFERIEDYITSETWKLVKLHGSVNWGVPLEPLPGANSLLDHLWKLEEDPYHLKGDIKMLPNHQTRTDGQRYLYPCLSIPVANKTEFVCPTPHSTVARGLLSESNDVLILGCRLADPDVLNLLTSIQQIDNLMIVDRDDGEALRVLMHLAKSITAFNRPEFQRMTTVHRLGFSDFVSSGALRRFLSGKT